MIDLERIEQLVECSHYAVWFARCKDCGALYVCCYIEVWDASWSFYAPVERDELFTVRSEKDEVRALIANRPHIVWPPSSQDPYWSDLVEGVLMMGPRP